VGAGIAGQRVDHDGRHRRLGKAYLSQRSSNGTSPSDIGRNVTRALSGMAQVRWAQNE
jgi:hypothetical protein